jgi:hypothetical protein
MADESDFVAAPSGAGDIAGDVGAYCRAVEAHLTRTNGGHLVRIVGPGFEMVRGWATDGVPLSVVCRGIELKAARHHAGAGRRRPLRIEFCEDDVRVVFDEWRRAVGLAPAAEESPTVAADVAPAGEPGGAARRAATKELDRAIDRLARASGRLDWPDGLREVVSARLAALTGIRDGARGVRGEARAAMLARVAEGDAGFGAAIRASAPADVVADVRAEAVRELAAYRGRLAPAAWAQAIDLTADRLLRSRLGLPT